MGQIREKSVSKKLEGHVGLLGAHIMTAAHKLACIHSSILHALTYNLAQFALIRDTEVSLELGRQIHFGALTMILAHTLEACMLNSCVLQHLSLLKWVR